MRPVPPATRFISQGTALEINNHLNAAPLPPGTNLLDRLRPEIPPPPVTVAPLTAVPPLTRQAGNPSASASAPDKSDKTTDKAGGATGAVRHLCRVSARC